VDLLSKQSTSRSKKSVTKLNHWLMHYVTTFKIMKKIIPFLLCWQWTYSASSLLTVQKSL
jgi:hypothetical protein